VPETATGEPVAEVDQYKIRQPRKPVGMVNSFDQMRVPGVPGAPAGGV
jgi:hypothetical protein